MKINEIIDKKIIAKNIIRFKIHNPDIANARKCGQFIIIRVDETGERIPLTIANADDKEGFIELIVQIIGTSTKKLSRLNINDFILDIAGPLGNPTHIEKYGTCVMIGGGLGCVPLLSITKELKNKENEIISIIGAKTKDSLILENEIKDISKEIYITTDDGSYGNKGFVTEPLEKLINSDKKIDFVTAVGPVQMMQAICAITKKHNIPTMVSLNPIMVDGTGMCGGCRCIIDGKQKFACIHGPEFDGHKVDFEMLLRRTKMFESCEL